MTASTLLLPAPDAAWRVWRPRASTSSGNVDSPVDAAHLAKPLVIGLPASACRSIGLTIPQADPDVMEQLIVTNLERRGLRLDSAKGGKNYRWHLLGQAAGQAIISVDVLADPFPENLAAEHAGDYTAALRLLELPAGQLVITEEQGNLVLAAGHQGKLFHSHIFAQSGAPDDALALELTLARLALEADLGAGSITGVILAGNSFESRLADRLSKALDLPVRAVAELSPKKDSDTKNWLKMLPASVREAQAARASRSKMLRWILLGSGLALSLIFLGYAYLVSQQRRVDELEREVELIREPATAVKETAARWKSFAPAVDTQRYPMFLLAEITRLMPGTGIVIRDFEFKGSSIELRGEARDAQIAFQFIEDFKKNKILSRYTWTSPSPEVKGTTATFRAQGKLQ
ncbi:MAG: hypothetical protein IPK32_17030 [Verrucomicrobiaceae bacterium]|nr:hypothetical protein [Verrucomicrobiaceae bacterium]